MNMLLPRPHPLVPNSSDHPDPPAPHRKGAHRLRPRQRLGKYRIEQCLSDGNYANVYRAYDTIEGIRVALKIPHPHLADEAFLDSFRHEVRLSVKLDPSYVVTVKDANHIGPYFVIAYPLGLETLGDRMQRRLALTTILDFAQQAIEAVAHAHQHKIIHCDIKPENFILFPANQLCLTDFGIAKLALRTRDGSGSGTLGFIAPEQAMGKPSFRSDVFALGLILYKMLSGKLPSWPFDWPPPGIERLRKKVHPDLIDLLQKSLQVYPSKRYRDANQMLAAFEGIKIKTRPTTQRKQSASNKTSSQRDWRAVRFQQFKQSFGRQLETRHTCQKCNGPVSEFMRTCPWCGVARATHKEATRFPARCPRCLRGVKLDWHYCPWCYGPGFETPALRRYPDKRYTAQCGNPSCGRRDLMPFMKYCPWCRRLTRKKWKIEGSRDRCPSCQSGVVRSFWSFCPWCAKRITPH